MFFPLSKIVWFLLAPLNLVFLLLVASALLALRWKRAARALFIVTLALFTVFGVLPTGHNLLVWLEGRHPQPQELPAQIDGILVLGGSFESELREARGQPVLNDSAERLLAAHKLSTEFPNAAVIYSGGNGTLRGGASEAEDVRELFAWARLAMPNVLYEEESRNTYENIKFSRNLFKPYEEETWLLVTSAFHMRRAMAIAHTLRWPGNLIAYPVDYKTAGAMSWAPSPDILGNFYKSTVALREIIGYLAYSMTGRISLSAE